jgi:isoleucyl-tRNA synthetase
MKPVAAKVSELSTEEITEYEESGSIELDLGEDGIVQLGKEGLEITRTGLEGWSVETEAGLSVALDTELTPELVKEGLAREFVNRIQNMRKEADFDVVDRITIGFEGSDKLEEAVEAMEDYIKSETLAEEIEPQELEVSDFVKSWEIGDDESTISIRRNPN